MGAITQQFQDFARENGGGLIKLEIKANREKEPEPPIRSTIEALQNHGMSRLRARGQNLSPARHVGLYMPTLRNRTIQ